MRIIFLLLLPVFSVAQLRFDTVTLLSGKVKMLSPKVLSTMPDEMWFLKYRNTPRPVMALSDEDGEVNLIGQLTQQPATEDQLIAYKDFNIGHLKSKRPDMVLLDDGIKTINGRKAGYIKFITQAIDQKVFNYYFFIIVEGKVLLFTFNCIQKLQKKWERIADQMVASISTE